MRACRGIPPAAAPQYLYPIALTHAGRAVGPAGNRIACEGAVVLSRVLEAEKPRLQTLVLSENKVSARGSGALCQTLLSNTTLTFLSLAGNQLGDYGATEVASMLRLNQVAVRPSAVSAHEALIAGSGRP